jgi:hypothetical protein
MMSGTHIVRIVRRCWYFMVAPLAGAAVPCGRL